MDVFALPATRALLRAALDEDLASGDLTSQLTVRPETRARAEIRTKEPVILAGVPIVGRIVEAAGIDLRVDEVAKDGDRAGAGDLIARLSGNARNLLAIERVTLNFLQHLTGIATQTADFVATVAGCGARIVDTRKTLPGLRTLQKYAVRMGGGFNHRQRLDDGILIKDNHIVAAGGIAAAVLAAQAGAPHGIKVEIECTTIGEVTEALNAGAEIILLDNMTIDELTRAVQRIAGRALVEASGGVTLGSVRAIAETGVDLISIGALTHSVPAADIHMSLFLE
jgi:nicotinate-nucleotide pyrophosphorylase (carboxylating)